MAKGSKSKAKQAAKDAKRQYKLDKMGKKASGKQQLAKEAGKIARTGMVTGAINQRTNSNATRDAAIAYYNAQIANQSNTDVKTPEELSVGETNIHKNYESTKKIVDDIRD